MAFYQNIIDTHAHYDDGRYDGARSVILAAQHQNGVVAIINNGSDEASSAASIALAEAHPFVYAAVGVHPHEVCELEEGWLERIEAMAAHEKAVAIGEIGLDYYYENTDREAQKEAFRAQLMLANRLGMPVEIHDRDAHGDIMDIVRELKPAGCVHRYSGSPEMAKELTKLGLYLGIGGALTYKNSKKEVETVRQTPLEYLLLETDCPYLSPAPYRGKVCTSDMLSLVAERIAEIKGDVSPQEVADITAQNARRVFGLK